MNRISKRANKDDKKPIHSGNFMISCQQLYEEDETVI